MHHTRLSAWLGKTSPFWFALFTATTAFLLYTCVYGFRKTFSVAAFEGIVFFGISYKVWLVTAQVLGYAASKFIGIKIVSETKGGSRTRDMLVLMSIAGVSWLLFALCPAPYNIIFLVTNGLPLGMMWGLIFSTLEGRQTTDLLGAGLSASFIFSAGFAKSVGSWLMTDWHVSEIWMPFAACLVFLLPLLLFTWLLQQVPPPSAIDEQLRTKRVPMDSVERKKFMMRFGPGLVVLIGAYMLLTTLRDFRDNFTPEIWEAVGNAVSPELFTQTEIPIAIIVLGVVGSLVLIRNNERALRINHLIIIAGLCLIGISTFLFQVHIIPPSVWMIVSGTGLYLGYVPFNSIFFERLIGAFRYVGTVGFVMYLADAFGYLGSVGVLLLKEFGFHDASWLNFYISSAYLISIAGMLLMCVSLFYFERKLRNRIPEIQIPAVEVALPGRRV